MMIFELIQGEAGFYVGCTGFFKALMEILKENKIAIMADEIQTFGRTSALFAFQHFNLEDYIDICTIGKLSLACATLFSEEYRPKPGLLSQTFTASTASIRAGKWIVEKLQNGHFFGPQGRNVEIQSLFHQRLRAIQAKFPERVHGPFGIGGMVAFTPYDGSLQKAIELVHALFAAGVITFTAGTNPTRVRMLPPVGVIKDEEIEQVMNILEKTLCT